MIPISLLLALFVPLTRLAALGVLFFLLIIRRSFVVHA
jgi:hypothetical protein